MTGIDRNADAVASLHQQAEIIIADLEQGPWPLTDRQFDAVIVTNYLWRERFDKLLTLLGDDGVLLYETFTWGNERYGQPSRPEFLLHQGELLALCKSLHIVAFEEGQLENPLRCVQRIAACRSATKIPALNEHGYKPTTQTCRKTRRDSNTGLPSPLPAG